MATSALPAASFAAVVMVAVYCVLAVRLLEGTNIAVSPLTTTTPPTIAPPAVSRRVKLAVLSVELVIASEKVADTEPFSAMPVAALAGDVEDTVGGVESAIGAVVTTVGVVSGACSAPPPPCPQPSSARLANRDIRVAEKMRAETRDLILPFDILICALKD